MWRRFRSDKETRFPRPIKHVDAACSAAAIVTCAFLVSCQTDMEYQLHQPIQMGPWTFEVDGVKERIDRSGSGDRMKRVIVFLELHNYRERHEKPFDDFLNGNSPKSMIAFPRMKLVDQEGNRFDGWLSPLSGGSLRSERWQADFVLIPFSMRDMMRANASDLAAEHLHKHPADFRLVIENPVRRQGQPRRVTIQLE